MISMKGHGLLGTSQYDGTLWVVKFDSFYRNEHGVKFDAVPAWMVLYHEPDAEQVDDIETILHKRLEDNGYTDVQLFYVGTEVK